MFIVTKEIHYDLLKLNTIFFSQITAGNNVKRNARSQLVFSSATKWEAFNDQIPNFADTSLKANALLEHMNVTKDASDYLWYTLR